MIAIYILVGLICFLLIRAASIESTMFIEKKIKINKSATDVFNEVKFLKNQSDFNKWMMADPNLKIEYSGTDGSVGFTSHWQSEIKNVGEGTQKITGILEANKIDSHLTFIKPFAGTAESSITVLAEDGNTCMVTWSFSGPRNFMAKVMQVILNIEKTLGNDLVTSLTNLKQKLEKN